MTQHLITTSGFRSLIGHHRLFDRPQADVIHEFSVGVSNICQAFEPHGVMGTKVLRRTDFLTAMCGAIAGFDWNTCRTPGQAVIEFPAGIPLISCGNTFIQDVQDNELLGRMHRRVPHVCATREGIRPRAPARSCSLVVYTREAYNGDPDVLKENDSTEQDYVVVAVLSPVVDTLPYPATRLVHNIAGGNKGFVPKTTVEEVQRWLECSRKLPPAFFAAPQEVIISSKDIEDDLKLAEDANLLHWIIGEAKKSEAGAEQVILVSD